MPSQYVPSSEWRADAKKISLCRPRRRNIYLFCRGEVAALQAQTKCVFHTQKYFWRVREARRRVPDTAAESQKILLCRRRVEQYCRGANVSAAPPIPVAEKYSYCCVAGAAACLLSRSICATQHRPKFSSHQKNLSAN